jgi:hypothetical protein
MTSGELLGWWAFNLDKSNQQDTIRGAVTVWRLNGGIFFWGAVRTENRWECKRWPSCSGFSIALIAKWYNKPIMNALGCSGVISRFMHSRQYFCRKPISWITCLK